MQLANSRRFDFLKGNLRHPEPLQPQMKNRPQLIITKGDIVLMMSTRQVKDPNDPSKTYQANHFEMVRVENGLAKEHWDSSIGPGGKRN